MSKTSTAGRVYRKPRFESFPELLRENGMNEMPNFRIFTPDDADDPARAVHEFARKIGGAAYTQTEAEGEIHYDRGFHLINRTRVYAAVWRRGGYPN